MKRILKKLSLVFAGVAFFCSISEAQYNGVEVRINTGGMVKGSSMMEFGGFPEDEMEGKITGLSLDVTGRYGISEKSSLTLRAGLRRFAFKAETVTKDVNDYIAVTKADASNTTIVIAPGISRNFELDKLYFFAGLELPFTIIGKTEGEYTYVSEDNGGPIDNDKSNFSFNGGFAAGLNAVAGFRYAIAGPLVLGMDLTTGFQYAMIKPDFKAEYFSNGTLTDQDSGDVKVTAFGVTPIAGSLVVGLKF